MFYLWIKQAGEGCDYTIGCGQRLFQLKSTTVEDATTEAIKEMSGWHHECVNNHDEQVAESALLLQSMSDLKPYLIENTAKLRTSLSEREQEKKLAEFERLKKELGK